MEQEFKNKQKVLKNKDEIADTMLRVQDREVVRAKVNESSDNEEEFSQHGSEIQDLVEKVEELQKEVKLLREVLVEVLQTCDIMPKTKEGIEVFVKTPKTTYHGKVNKVEAE